MPQRARRYQLHFVWPFARRMDLGERKISSSTSEPLSDARTMLADFFSILLEGVETVDQLTQAARTPSIGGKGQPRQVS
jgi:hypothetical protein